MSQGWPGQVHPSHIHGLFEMGCGKVFIEVRFVLRLYELNFAQVQSKVQPLDFLPLLTSTALRVVPGLDIFVYSGRMSTENWCSR